MREDQRKRLEDLTEKLIEQTIDDVDPGNWSGAGQLLARMDKETRGDALWCRKIATQTVLLLSKVQLLIVDPAVVAGKSHVHESDVDTMTKRAEREADELMQRVQAKTKGYAHRAKH